MSYENPTVNFDVGENQPFFCDIIDQDGEMLRFEWNGGDVICTVPNFKVPTKTNGLEEAIHYTVATPNIPVLKIINALLTFHEKCTQKEEEWSHNSHDGFEGDVYKRD